MATPPRQIEADSTFFVTVRAVGRSCRFVPNRQTRESIDFLFKAVVAEFEGKIELHEFQFLSNHFHLLGTDVAGVLPDFMRELNSRLSRQLNAIRGIRGTNFEKDYNLCVVDMKQGRRAFEHAVYILANAVSAHLVERSFQWLGANSYGLEYGQEQVVKRPSHGLWSGLAKHANRKGSKRSKRSRYAHKLKTPEQVTFKLKRPPIYRNLSAEKLREKIRAAVREREDELIASRKQQRKTVLGFKRASQVRYTRSPRTKEEHFKRRPMFSANSSARYRYLRQRYLDFVEARKDARDQWLAAVESDASIKHITFPPGTWLIQLSDGQVCGRNPHARAAS